MVNWKLIFQLSLLGLAMAFATVFWIPQNIEPAFWLVIFIISAWLIAKICSGKFFVNGFLVSMVNSVWITAVHIAFFDTYMANHPDMGPDEHQFGRLLMIIMGPVIGALSGIILGIFAFIAGKAFKKYMNK
jgi:hypothetical protein